MAARAVAQSAAKPAAKPIVGDDAVRAKTGRTWAQWIAALDAAGARGRSHRDIVAMLRHRFRLGPWWQQMVTVGYERATGQRAAHQRASGYGADISRTFAAPCTALARAFEDARARAAWLRVKGASVRSGTAGKVIRLDWPDGTRVEVRFRPKGRAKSSAAVEHSRLASLREVTRMKAVWAEAFERLRERLE